MTSDQPRPSRGHLGLVRGDAGAGRVGADPQADQLRELLLEGHPGDQVVDLGLVRGSVRGFVPLSSDLSTSPSHSLVSAESIDCFVDICR